MANSDVNGRAERTPNAADMSDTLKSRLSAIFLPKSTYKSPSTETMDDSNQAKRSSAPNSTGNRQPQQAGPARHHFSGLHVPVINDRDARQRRQQTLESENARNEIIIQGIRVRDFQEEADERRYGTGAVDTAVGAGQTQEEGRTAEDAAEGEKTPKV